MSRADFKMATGQCDAGSDLGIALWSSDGQPPYSGSLCGSTEMSNYDNNGFWEDYEFWMQRMVFNFFEDEGGASAALSRLRLPPGTYIFPSQNFIVEKPRPNTSWFWMRKKWTINMIVIVEPSMAEVNMPSIMDMTVRDIGNNRLTGEGDVFISVQGSLGRSLRVQVFSANAGLLRQSRVGAMAVPYSLSLSELAGNFRHFKLIENGLVRPEVNIPLVYGVGFEHPLRLNASFDVSKSGLDSGYYSDNVTLIYSTNDIP